MTVRMRHTKGHRNNRRSHFALSKARLTTCPNCGAQHENHTMCANCGHYRGKKIVDMQARAEKKMERAKQKRKLRGLEEEPAKEPSSAKTEK